MVHATLTRGRGPCAPAFGLKHQFAHREGNTSVVKRGTKGETSKLCFSGPRSQDEISFCPVPRRRNVGLWGGVEAQSQCSARGLQRDQCWASALSHSIRVTKPRCLGLVKTGAFLAAFTWSQSLSAIDGITLAIMYPRAHAHGKIHLQCRPSDDGARTDPASSAFQLLPSPVETVFPSSTSPILFLLLI